MVSVAVWVGKLPHSVVYLRLGQVNPHRSLLGKDSDGWGGGRKCSQPAVAEVAVLTRCCAVGSHWSVSAVPLLCRLAAVLPVAIGKMPATLCRSGSTHNRNSARGGLEEVTGGGDTVPMHRDCGGGGWGGGGGRGGGQPKWNWVSPMQES